jgi:GxxExxY protein
MEINDITGIIIEEAIRIHNDLGPGLLESVYEELLAYRLNKRNMQVKRQHSIPIRYEEVRMDNAFRADLVVNDEVIVEIKSVDTLVPVHHKQLLTYLKLTNITVGLLINFNEPLLRNGIRRIVNNYQEVNNYTTAASAPQRETKL